jgi:hypothetical protein
MDIMANSDLILPGHIEEAMREDREADTSPASFALSELAEDYVFFNHGALFAFAEFQDPHEDPLNDWHAQMPANTELIKHPFDRAIFAGIDAPCYDGRLTWDHVICAVQRHNWDGLFAFLNGVASISSKNKAYYQVFSGVVKVLDPVLVERHGIFHPGIPQIEVTVFCVDGNKARWEIRNPGAITGCPTMMKMPPNPEIIQRGIEMLHGDISSFSDRTNVSPEFAKKFKDAAEHGPKIVED